MKFRRIIFDFDGTVIIHDKEKEASQLAKFLKLDKSLIPEFKKRLDTFFSTETYKKLYSNKKITEGLYLDLIDKVINPEIDFNVTKQMVYDAMCKKAKYFTIVPDGLKDALEYLYEKGYELCILTNGFYIPQFDILKYVGLAEYFNRIYAWDNFYAKPNKRAFYRAVGNLEPREVVMIGDDLINDIKPAKEIGMYTIGYMINSNDKVMPDMIISSYNELTNIF